MPVSVRNTIFCGTLGGGGGVGSISKALAEDDPRGDKKDSDDVDEDEEVLWVGKTSLFSNLVFCLVSGDEITSYICGDESASNAPVEDDEE